MKVVFTFLMLTLSFLLNAQPVAMADKMRESGKIYVVVAVLLIIMVGLIAYLISIDKKVGKLEKELKA